MALADPHAYAHHLADQYNRAMERKDIEWAVGPNGDLYLRDKPEFTRWNTNAIERRHERERQEWMRNNPPHTERRA